MKKLTILRFFVTILLLKISTGVFSQNSGVDYHLLLQNEKRWVPENFDDFLKNNEVEQSEIINGKYYRILQFFEIPTEVEKAKFEQSGIEFIGYLPSRAYVVSFPKKLKKENLENKGVRSILPIDNKMKIDKTLLEIDLSHASVHGDEIEVLVSFYKNIELDWVETTLRNEKVNLIKMMDEAKKVIIQIAIQDLEEIANLPFVFHLSIKPKVGEPEDRLGRSLHRSNMINTEYSGGKKYDGEGIGVLVRDDGRVGPHIDFKGRNFQTAQNNWPGSHADGVAGIFAGAGNLDPDMKGMASGSDLYVIDYFEDYEENLISLDLHQNEGVLVVNSSFSDGCNAGYTEITESVDRHIFENPTFLHVFSAGNSNNLDCNYGAGNQWGNITGGHKQGKNVIATANVFENAVIASSSSRGPAHDGRIKPDITANGQAQNSTNPYNKYRPFGGTSGAAPGVAGVTAQLHHAFRELNGGTTASSALMKSTLMNTANDLGNEGPDFIFGWGHLNAFRALALLEDSRYDEGQISQGGNNMHTINVPSGTVQVRMMVYWNDPASMIGTSKALINDLDMIVTAPDGSTKLPWVLDTTPDSTALATPATNGEDHLNNVEQVVFDNPLAGDYTIDISGFEIPFGPQDYYVLYEIISEEITVTYPIGGEGFQPDSLERIRWDAYGNDSEFLLEYTTNNGSTWQTITTTEGSRRMFLWTPPAEISGQARVRVSRLGFSDESDENFSIIEIPNNLEVLEFCSDDFIRVGWDPVIGATGYDVFYLGEKFMDSVGTTNLTEFDLPLPSPFGEHWFSVRAIGDNGLRGKRAIAKRYNGGLFNCDLTNDAIMAELFVPDGTSIAACGPFEKTVSIQVKNGGNNPQSNLSFSYQFENQTIVTEMYSGTLAVGETVEHTFSTMIDFPNSGTYDFKTWCTIPNDEIGFNDTITRQIFVSQDEVLTPSPNIQEDFEVVGFPPQNWFVSNPEGDVSWEQISSVIGADGDFTRAAMMRNQHNDNLGSRDVLLSVPVDLTNSNAPILFFDYAYGYKSQNCSDTLVVDLYTECGENYIGEIYRKAGTTLLSAGIWTENSVPFNANDWRSESILFDDYAGETVVLKFVSINDRCGSLYLDNINITSFDAPTANFSTVTETCVGELINLENNSNALLATYYWSFGQDASQDTSILEMPDSIFYITPGEKTISLIVTNDLGIDTITQTVNVLPTPTADFSTNQVGDGYQFTNESEDGSTYFWDFGDGTSSIDENPFKTYSTPGTYTIKLTTTNICSEDIKAFNLDVTVTNVNNLSEKVNIQIIPNPNNGVFNLKIEDVVSRNLEIEIIDVQGKSLGKWQTETNAGILFFPIKKETLNGGLYFLKVQSEFGNRVLKMTVF